MKIFKKVKDGYKRDIFIGNLKIFSYYNQMYKAAYNKKTYNGKEIYYSEKASETIKKMLLDEKPCMIARWGTTEATIVKYYLEHINENIIFPDLLKANLANLSGFFPIKDEYCLEFCKRSVEIAKSIDCLAVRARNYEKAAYYLEDFFCKNICKSPTYVDIEELTPFSVKNPWTKALKNKKVLVIHPFVNTIKEQYKKRTKLFKNKNILPEFELKTIKAVQSLADEKENLTYSSWFEALDNMFEQIKNTDFDVAIIGAGAYGMFLAEYCKRIGKKAIHIGGATQILFGIKGKRYDDKAYWVHKFYNKFWVYPLDSEKPLGSKKVEGGCYWK